MQGAKGKRGDLVTYWRGRVAKYVRTQREKRGTRIAVEAETGFSAATLKAIETQLTDPSIGTLVQVLEAVRGDISEAFRSHVPKKFHGDQQHLHEQLAEILTKGGPDAAIAITRDLRNAYAEFVDDKNPGANR